MEYRITIVKDDITSFPVPRQAGYQKVEADSPEEAAEKWFKAQRGSGDKYEIEVEPWENSRLRFKWVEPKESGVVSIPIRR